MRILKWGLIGLIGLIIAGLIAVRVWPMPDYTPYELNAEERAFVDTVEVPAFAPDWAWGEFESFDGTKLRWGQTGNAQTAKATLIYVPGFNGTIEAYAEQFGLWAREGYHVVGMDMRGQGGSEGNPHGEKLPAFIQGGEVVNARDIISFVNSLAIEERPVILSGSSYGGIMTTLAVLQDPDFVDGYLSLVPAYLPKLPGDPLELETQMRRMVWLGMGDRYTPGQSTWRPFTEMPEWCPTGHPRIFHQVKIHADDPTQRVQGFTFSMGADWLQLGREIADGERGSFALPTTMILSPSDALVENGPPTQVCERDAMCELRVWEDVSHCVTLGPDEHVLRVAEEADGLLERIGHVSN
jgi:alpha-beta hydrolase superfamily lysophospholipase